MKTTPEEVISLFRKSGRRPFWSHNVWEVSVRLPLKQGGAIFVSVQWADDKEGMVSVNSAGVATVLPFVEFSDFEVMFISILKGCVLGTLQSRELLDLKLEAYKASARKKLFSALRVPKKFSGRP